MKIEVGRCYEAETGAKIGPMWLPEWGEGAYASKDLGQGGMWNEDGSALYKGAKDSPTLVREWTDTPEVGTLQEIGAQVGDVVKWKSGVEYAIGKIDGGFYFEVDDMSAELSGESGWRIISRAQPKPEQTGPVRTVTRTTREIVPGVYGFLWVSPVQGSNNQVTVGMRNSGDDTMQQVGASDLTEAIQTLTAIRDALKENGE